MEASCRVSLDRELDTGNSRHYFMSLASPHYFSGCYACIFAARRSPRVWVDLMEGRRRRIDLKDIQIDYLLYCFHD